MREETTSLLFRYRGFFMAPFGFFLLLAGRPTVFSYVAGTLLVFFGEAIRFWGVGYAGKTTRKEKLEAPFLVTAGPYRFVRHPLYLGNAMTGLGGTTMAVGSWSWPAALIFFTLFTLFYGVVYGAIIPLEERFLAREFGARYEAYRAAVPQLFPLRPPFPEPEGTWSFPTACASEAHTLIPLFVLLLLMGLKIR